MRSNQRPRILNTKPRTDVGHTIATRLMPNEPTLDLKFRLAAAAISCTLTAAHTHRHEATKTRPHTQSAHVPCASRSVSDNSSDAIAPHMMHIECAPVCVACVKHLRVRIRVHRRFECGTCPRRSDQQTHSLFTCVSMCVLRLSIALFRPFALTGRNS